MAELCEVVAFLDRELRSAGVEDSPRAWNGLQLANDGEVPRVIAAVDASLAVIEEAALGGPGLLLVHHGMFWQGTQPLTGSFYRKIKTAIDAGLAVYSSHLPLDLHPKWGNNALLAEELGMEVSGPFPETGEPPVGLCGEWSGTRAELVLRLGELLGGPVHLTPGGPVEVSKLVLVTGGAGSEVAKAAAAGADTFLTGEGPHWSHVLAEELGINLIFAGHYATETFGVRAAAAHVAGVFGLEWSFVDRPGGR
jgi:dinuclear metal center YbgI/SA1388 family protein